MRSITAQFRKCSGSLPPPIHPPTQTQPSLVACGQLYRDLIAHGHRRHRMRRSRSWDIGRRIAVGGGIKIRRRSSRPIIVRLIAQRHTARALFDLRDRTRFLNANVDLLLSSPPSWLAIK